MTKQQNNGHGHIFPRPDGFKARCGGPALCSECKADYVRYTREKDATPGATAGTRVESILPGSSPPDDSRPREALTSNLLTHLRDPITHTDAEEELVYLCGSAADEIERLHADLERLSIGSRGNVWEEVRALRSALEHIRDFRCSAFRSYEQDRDDMQAIARRALSANPSAPETKSSLFESYPEGTLFQKQGTAIVAMLPTGQQMKVPPSIYALPVAQRESAGAPEVAGSNPAGQGSAPETSKQPTRNPGPRCPYCLEFEGHKPDCSTLKASAARFECMCLSSGRETCTAGGPPYWTMCKTCGGAVNGKGNGRQE